MGNPTSSVAQSEGTTGAFNYLVDGAVSSLFRNDKVFATRDKDGSDAGMVGVDTQSQTLKVLNARAFTGQAKKTCEVHGFEIVDGPLDDPSLDFHDHQKVTGHYYPQCEDLVRASTGATQVFAFDHNVRSAVGKSKKQRISGGQQVQGPAKMVHGDYTLVSAPQRLKDLALPPKANDTLHSVLEPGTALLSQAHLDQALSDAGRFAIINVWRNIAVEPVQTNPLAMCDGKTVIPSDLVTFEIRYHDRIGENYFAKYQSNHQFYYYPEMTRDEPLLLKQWDSQGALAQTNGERSDASDPEGPCTFSFHSAFDDLSVADDAPDRWSIEVRCIVIYD